MKKHIFIFLLLAIFHFSAFAQENRYFDVNNKEISKETFNEIRPIHSVIPIQVDSSHHFKLIKREEQGAVKDKAKLISLLTTAAQEKIDPAKPIVIIYYPGKDPYNSSGNTEYVVAQHQKLEKDLFKLYKTKPFFVYKDNTGLEKFGKTIKWVKDPEQTVEKLFFKYHYPCGSFTVISKNGDYISYFGEYMNSQVLEIAKKLSE